MTWNHLKLPRNYQKPTTQNQPHYSIFYLNELFSGCICPNTSPEGVFLGNFGPKIWSSPYQLKFVTDLHCYMLITILMFILFKFLSVIFFGANLVLYSEGVHCCMLIIILMFIFSKLLSVIFLDKFGPKVWSFANWLKFRT